MRYGDAPPTDTLDPAERMSVDELRATQLTRLRWTLRHAYDNVPHYRKSFDTAGVHPDDCRELADIAKFPTTSKADLRENYPFGMFAVPQDQVRRVHASSGTTGRPTVVGYTELKLRLGSGDLSREYRDSRAWAEGDTRPFAIEQRVVDPRTAHPRCRLGRHAALEQRARRSHLYVKSV